MNEMCILNSNKTDARYSTSYLKVLGLGWQANPPTGSSKVRIHFYGPEGQCFIDATKV